MADNILPQGKVPVVDPNGQFGFMDEASLPDALQNGGFKLADNNMIDSYVNRKKYGEGMANSLKAAALGAARGFSFGLSDYVLAKTGQADIDALRGLKEQNPIASTVGEVGGVAAGILTPGIDVINPVKGVAKIGQAATEAAIPAASKAANIVAKAESLPLANRILTKAGATAVGSAVEGAAYGAGQQISEAALGDPDQNAQSIISNIGMSALLGGGLGAVVGGGVEAATGAGQKLLGKLQPKFVSEMDKAAVEAGDLSTIVKTSELPPQEKENILKGLTQKKKNAAEIEAAAQDIGAPLLESQISDSRLVQRIDDSLINGDPTFASMKRQALAKAGWEKAGEAVENIVGPVGQYSETQVGNVLKEGLTSKLENQNKLFRDLYRNVNESFPVVPVKEDEIINSGLKILQHPEIEGLERIGRGTAPHNLVQDYVERLHNVKTLEDIKGLRTLLGDSVSGMQGTPKMKFLAGLIGDELKDLEERSLINFANENSSRLANPEAVQQLMFERQAANATYKEEIDKVKKLAKALGKRKVYGFNDAKNFIDDMNSQQIAKKLFSERNTEFVDWFAKNYPSEFDTLKKYQIAQIRDTAMTDGVLDTKKVLKKIDNLEPEIKNALFSADELKKLNNVKLYLDNMPKNFNPSGTAREASLKDFFSLGGIMANVRDKAMEEFIKGAVKGEGVIGNVVNKLSGLERMVMSTDNKINSSTSAFFKNLPNKESVAGYGGAKLVPKSAEEKKKARQDHDEMVAKINQLQADPHAFIEKLDDMTKPVYKIAPQMAQGLQTTTVRAAQFLQSKAPQKPQQAPLSSPYQISDAEIAKFQRYYEVVENPLVALQNLQNGMLTKENMEALTVVYPQLYGKMQQNVTKHMVNFLSKNSVDKIPYEKKMMLSMFMGQDLTDSLKQPYLMTYQMAYKMPSMKAQQMMMPKMPKSKGLTGAAHWMTDTQKITLKGGKI